MKKTTVLALVMLLISTAHAAELIPFPTSPVPPAIAPIYGAPQIYPVYMQAGSTVTLPAPNNGAYTISCNGGQQINRSTYKCVSKLGGVEGSRHADLCTAVRSALSQVQDLDWWKRNHSLGCADELGNYIDSMYVKQCM